MKVYKSHSIWDEEQERQKDKYDAIGGDENGPEYHGQADYNSGGDQSDVYNAEKGGEEKKEEEAKGVEKNVMKEDKKYEKKGEATEEDIKRKAASDVHEEGKKGSDDKKKKKEHKSIEDAINKAMKEEKEIIYVDD